MEKQLLLKNILIELDQLPEAYLQQWYELIHTFREKLSDQKSSVKQTQKTDFDWDVLVEEVMKNRQQNNLHRTKRIETMFNDL